MSQSRISNRQRNRPASAHDLLAAATRCVVESLERRLMLSDPGKIAFTSNRDGNDEFALTNTLIDTGGTGAFDPANVSAGGPYTISEGDSLTLAGSATDPDGQPLTYAWDLNGDGVFTDATGANPTLTWDQLKALGINNGPRTISTVKVRATTILGVTADSPATVLTINDTPPTIALTGAAVASAGQTYTLTLGAVTDPGSDQLKPMTVTNSLGMDVVPDHLVMTDLTGDGKADLAVVGWKLMVFRSNGDGTFAPRVDYALRGRALAVTAADLNGDGRKDLALADYYGDAVSVFLNQGGGTFGTRADYTLAGPGSVAAGDFNGDGRIDLVASNYDSTTFSTLLNLGNGTFGSRTDYSIDETPRSVAVGDFNGDNKLDLVVGHVSYKISFFYNSGSGAFPTRVDRSIGSTPADLVPGDYDADGKIDLAVQNTSGPGVTVLRNNGNGSFAAADYAVTAGTDGMVAADMNGDAKLDLVASNWVNVNVLLNQGDGTFGMRLALGVGISGGLYAVGVGDINGDSKPEIATGSTDYQVRTLAGSLGPYIVRWGDGSADMYSAVGAVTHVYSQGAAGARTITVDVIDSEGTHAGAGTLNIRVNQAPTSVSAGGPYTISEGGSLSLKASGSDPDDDPLTYSWDVNGDGIFDDATGDNPTLTWAQLVALGIDNGPRTSVSLKVRASDGLGGTTGSAATTLTVNDTPPTIALSGATVANPGQPYTVTLGAVTDPGRERAIFGTPDNFTAGTAPSSVAMGDFNNDGFGDLAVANQNGSSVTILLNNGSGGYIYHTDVYVASGPSSIVAGDLNKDGMQDLVVTCANASLAYVLIANGNGLFSIGSVSNTGSVPYSANLVDFNADGNLDLAVANYNSHGFSVFMGSGGTSFGGRSDYYAGGYRYPLALASGDFTGDGKPDIALTNLYNSTVSVFANTGSGSFAWRADYSTGNSPYSVALTDFTGDGMADLAVASAGSNIVMLLRNQGNGTFATLGVLGTSGGPNGLTAADLNNDAKPDLAVASGSSTLTVFYNMGSGSFGGPNNYTAGSSPVWVIAGDANNDGNRDLVVANQGSGNVSVFIARAISQYTVNWGDGTSDTYSTPGDKTHTYTTIAPSYTITVDVTDVDGTHTTAGTLTVSGNRAPTNVSTGGPYTISEGDGLAVQASASDLEGDAITYSWDINGDGTFDDATGASVTLTWAQLEALGIDNGTRTIGTFAVRAMDSLGNFTDARSVLTLNNAAPTIAITGSHNVINAGATYTLTLGAITDPGNEKPGGFGTASYVIGASSPSAIALGDFNGDGKLDMAVCNTSYNEVRIYKNNGDGTYTQKLYVTGTNPQAVAIGDFDSDGKLDVAVGNATSNTISVFRGNGDGTLAPKVDYPSGTAPSSIAIGDFNNDSKPDLAVANKTGGNVSIFRGNGDGTFAAKTDVTTYGAARVVAGDFDHDGKLDLAVTNDASSGYVNVLRGNGDGTFASGTSYSVGSYAYGLAAADFNDDGWTDLAATSSLNNLVAVFLNNATGAGTFAAKVTCATGTRPYDIAVVDMNGDSKPDLAVATNTTSNLGVNALRNLGDGTFAGAIAYQTNSNASRIAAGDLNGDGLSDLAVLIGGIYVLPGQSVSAYVVNWGDGTSDTYYAPGMVTHVYTTSAYGMHTISVDLVDADGTHAAAGTRAVRVNTPPTASAGGPYVINEGDSLTLLGSASDPDGDPLSSYLWDINGDGTFSDATGLNPTLTWAQLNALGINNGPRTLTNVKFKVHEFIANTESAAVTLTVNDTAPTIALDGASTTRMGQSYSLTLGAITDPGLETGFVRTTYSTGSTPNSIATGDLNGDGKPDLVVANGSPYTVSVLLNNGDGTFAAKVDYSTSAAPVSAAIADLNGDGKADLALVCGSKVNVFLNNGDGTFAPRAEYTANTSDRGIAVGDLNNDARPDLIVGNSSLSSVSIFLNSGNGAFAAKTDTPTGAGPYAVAVGDFDSDGWVDVATANYSSITLSVLRNNQDGTFAKTDYSTADRARTLVAGDFNGDGKLDLAVGTYASTASSFACVFLNQGDGSFAPKVSYATGNNPWGMAAADFNRDGKLDLATANKSGNSVSLLLNNGDGTFAARTDVPSVVGPSAVVVADFNGDTLPDLATSDNSGSYASVLLARGVVRYLVHWGDGTTDSYITNGSKTHTYANGATGNRSITVDIVDSDGTHPGAGSHTVQVQSSEVVARFVFYNNSGFDVSSGDDAAIAQNPDGTSKRALLPGQTATFANYTSYSRGINGVMVDLMGLANADSLSAADFHFRVGNSNTPDGWANAPEPSSISVRPGAGTGGSDRITLIWADNAIQKQWLQITVLANANTGLTAPDIFYFGNAIAEAGNSTLNAAVDAADELLARANGTGLGTAAITNPCDYNRDKRVNTQDQLIARSNRSGLTPLKLITVPAAGAAVAADAMSGLGATASPSTSIITPSAPIADMRDVTTALAVPASSQPAIVSAPMPATTPAMVSRTPPTSTAASVSAQTLFSTTRISIAAPAPTLRPPCAPLTLTRDLLARSPISTRSDDAVWAGDH